MSDKIREFIEVPQQFVQDGNQVFTVISKFKVKSQSRLFSFWHVAQSLHKKVRSNTNKFKALVHTAHRIPPDLQGSCGGICCDGIYRLLCQAYSHTNVRGATFSLLTIHIDLLCSNNILVYVVLRFLLLRAYSLEQRRGIGLQIMFILRGCTYNWFSSKLGNVILFSAHFHGSASKTFITLSTADGGALSNLVLEPLADTTCAPGMTMFGIWRDVGGCFR